MASKSRRSVPPLIEELRDRPYRFDFYQAVRTTELMRGVGIDPDSEFVPVGEGSDPAGKRCISMPTPRWLFHPVLLNPTIRNRWTSLMK